MEKEFASIAGIRIDALDFSSVVTAIVARAMGGDEPAYVVTPNAHHIVLLQDDPKFRHIYKHAYLSVPDGVPLLWAAKLLGTPLRGRVNGTDLFEALCAEASLKALRVFLLGGRDGAAASAAQVLKSRHPDLIICGIYCPPFGFERVPHEQALILDAISSARPDLLFVGLGAPKQEFWIYEHFRSLKVPVSIGIGVSFELVGNVVDRAPSWMRRTGLEWLYRFRAEPGRLWKRYLFGNTRFLQLVARQLVCRSWVFRNEPLLAETRRQ